MTLTYRLMQEGGVSGPVAAYDLDDVTDAEVITPAVIEPHARAWAAGQIGHPWDVLTVASDDGLIEFEVEL
jgi:hypothetical protein